MQLQGATLASIVMLMPMFIKTLILALLFVSGSVCAEWLKIGEGMDDSSFYIDPATIRQDGNLRTVWRKVELKIRAEGGQISSRSKLEFDCKKELFRLLAFSQFSEQMLAGKLLGYGDFPDARYRAIAPDTMDSDMMKVVCAW